jgi:hypothetical protein
MRHVEDYNRLSVLNIVFKNDSGISRTILLSLPSLVLCGNSKSQRKCQSLSIQLDVIIVSRDEAKTAYRPIRSLPY